MSMQALVLPTGSASSVRPSVGAGGICLCPGQSVLRFLPPSFLSRFVRVAGEGAARPCLFLL